jgi:hypothetical protein
MGSIVYIVVTNLLEIKGAIAFKGQAGRPDHFVDTLVVHPSMEETAKASVHRYCLGGFSAVISPE